MLQRIPCVRRSLTLQFIFWVGLILLGSIASWACINMKHHRQNAIDRVVADAGRSGDTMGLGIHCAMMLNSGDDSNQVIHNIRRQEHMQKLRIFNKEGGTPQCAGRSRQDHGYRSGSLHHLPSG